MKKITFLLFLGLAVVLTGCTKKAKDTDQDIPSGEVQTQADEESSDEDSNSVIINDKETITQDDATQESGIVYKDSEYGFTLKFPKSWEGYTTVNRELDWGDSAASDSIDFGLLEQKELFNISVHTEKQWNEITSTGAPHPTYLGENDQYIFGWANAHDVVNEEIGKRFEEIPSIIETFEL